MELVVGATILFCALIGKGVTKEIIFSNAVKLYAPEYLFDEFEKHRPRVKILSGVSSSEFDELFDKLKNRIEQVSRLKFEKFLTQANSLISDKDDTEYLALSLTFNKVPIWSNDPHFKGQSVVKVFTTERLVKHLKSLGHKF